MTRWCAVGVYLDGGRAAIETTSYYTDKPHRLKAFAREQKKVLRGLRPGRGYVVTIELRDRDRLCGFLRERLESEGYAVTWGHRAKPNDKGCRPTWDGCPETEEDADFQRRLIDEMFAA